MKVAHLITDLSVGGAEMMLWKLVSRLDRDQFQPLVISLTDEGPLAARIRSEGITVHVLRHDRNRPDLRAFVELVGLLKKEKPVILQSWLYHSDFLGTLAARLAAVPIVAWNVRGSEFRPEHSSAMLPLLIRGLSKISTLPDAIVVNSAAGQEAHLRLGYRPKRWVLIPNGFDTETFAPSESARANLRQELDLGPGALLIGLVARFDPLKDPLNFIQAAAILLKSHPEVRFVMIGRQMEASNRNLMEWVQRSGIGSSLHLLGERSDIPRLTAALDIASSTSYSEGFPNSLGEAMACCVPCVATDVGDSAAIVGDTGRIVAPSDPGAIAAAWRELVELGEEKRRELGARARLRIDERFGLGEVVRSYEDLYRRLATEKGLA